MVRPGIVAVDLDGSRVSMLLIDNVRVFRAKFSSTVPYSDSSSSSSSPAVSQDCAIGIGKENCQPRRVLPSMLLEEVDDLQSWEAPCQLLPLRLVPVSLSKKLTSSRINFSKIGRSRRAPCFGS